MYFAELEQTAELRSLEVCGRPGETDSGGYLFNTSDFCVKKETRGLCKRGMLATGDLQS